MLSPHFHLPTHRTPTTNTMTSITDHSTSRTERHHIDPHTPHHAQIATAHTITNQAPPYTIDSHLFMLDTETRNHCTSTTNTMTSITVHTTSRIEHHRIDPHTPQHAQIATTHTITNQAPSYTTDSHIFMLDIETRNHQKVAFEAGTSERIMGQSLLMIMTMKTIGNWDADD